MRRLLSLLFLSLLFCSAAFAQSVKKLGLIKGKLIDASTKSAFPDLRVTIPAFKIIAAADGDGLFQIDNVPYGEQTVVITGSDAQTKTINVTVNKSVTDMGEIIVEHGNGVAEDFLIPTIGIEDNSASDDDEGNTQNVSGFLNPTQDLFLYNSSYTFGQFRFRPRGFNSGDLQVNGFQVMDLARGWASYAQFGGLNNVLRGRSSTNGLKPSPFGYGMVNGILNYIDATAADQRKGTTVSYTLTNRLYRNRLMITHNSGLLKGGWAYSISASRRWAEEGYRQGTFYDGYSLYAAASKVMKKGQFNLTAIAATTRRGLSTTAIDEAYRLRGSNYYNPVWGYQMGEKRNSRVADVTQPMFIANYTHKPSDRTRWNTSLGYQFGQNNRTYLDFYNGYNPAPDYYRNLPYYYLIGTEPKPDVANAVEAQILANPDQLQIQWDNIYRANYMNFRTIQNANGSGQAVTGRQSIYVIGNYVDDMKKVSFNTNVEHAMNEHLSLYGGARVTSQHNRFYKELTDLLGGDFFINYNQFAAQASPGNPSVVQNNLDIPNQIIKVGDKYGYDYLLKILNASAWGQAVYTHNKLNFFAALNIENTGMSREGYITSGLFPDNSKGASDVHNFLTYGVKGGITYKHDAHHLAFVNGGLGTYAPNIHALYISERTRNTVVDNPESADAKMAEVGYQFKSPKFSASVTGYVTDMNNSTIVKRFFNDDPDIQSFVNYVMQNVGTRSIGTEIAASYNYNESINVVAVAAIGQTFYTNRPLVSVYQDNDPSATVASRQVYIKNYYLGVGPQSVYSLQFNYRPSRDLRANINFNYQARNFVDVNPDRRTQLAADRVDPASQQWQDIYGQEVLPAAFTIDLGLGYTLDLYKLNRKLGKGKSLVFNMGVVNALNKTDIKIVGYEQLRYDYVNHSPAKFPNKYDYAFGLNFFANVALRF